MGTDTLCEVPHSVRLPGCKHEVVRVVALKHPPGGLDIVAGKTPIALGVEVAQLDVILKTVTDAGKAVADLAGDKTQPAPWRFMIEHDAAAGKDAEHSAIIGGGTLGEELGN